MRRVPLTFVLGVVVAFVFVLLSPAKYAGGVPPEGWHVSNVFRVPYVSSLDVEPVPLLLEGLPDVFYDIVGCESGWDARARNPVSSASGLFQFVDGTWVWVWEVLVGVPAPFVRAWHAPVGVQVEAARVLYESEGLVPWAASEGCWG